MSRRGWSCNGYGGSDCSCSSCSNDFGCFGHGGADCNCHHCSKSVVAAAAAAVVLTNEAKETKVLEYLTRSPNPNQSPLSISKAIFGQDATARQINPTLYSLQRQGKLVVVYEDVQRKTKPTWSIANPSSSS